jgi:hypothetical protein
LLFRREKRAGSAGIEGFNKMSNVTSSGNTAAVKVTDPQKTDDIDRVERAVNQLVVDRARATGKGRRDVHLKHHGLVQGTFIVDDDIPAEFRHGVFQPKREYKAWIRFSSSNKFRASDTDPDGRGIAIKLLEVDEAGDRLSPPGVDQHNTQDFLLINGPAFFARNAADMAVAAELQQKDQFPSSFFASGGLLNGLAALAQMAQNQADSPLELTYFSQTPYKLGDQSYGVKYRVKPLSKAPAPVSNQSDPITDSKRAGDDYLYEALKARLDPSNEAQGEAVFEFAVQVGKDDGTCPLDDATVVWSEEVSPLQRVGELRIPLQKFDSKERMDFAEDISFNPWNGFVPHCPLGSLNAARIYAYRASRNARHKLNGVDESLEFKYSVAEWKERKQDAGTPYTPAPSERLDPSGQLISGFAMLLPNVGTWIADKLASRWGYAVAPVLLLGLLTMSWLNPAFFDGPPLIAAGLLPSERMIPAAEFSSTWKGKAFAKDVAFRSRDPKWVFRYAAIGTEAGGGIPYWVFRALPRMFPDRFGPSGDWSKFGLRDPDDTEYYASYHDLPRGVVLTTPEANLAGNRVDLALQVVAFNCATCHRGEYLDSQGKPHFVDGMPNTQIDAEGYKRAVIQSFRDERFNTVGVIRAINDLLALEHDKHPFFPGTQEATPTELSPVECVAYAAIVARAKQSAFAKPIAWLDDRDLDGPGRLDAFGALRYEFLGYPSSLKDVKIATVDLPSIWNQSDDWRTWHHYDGNTNDAHARNFGSIIGVGGSPLSIRKADVYTITNWLDGTLAPNTYDPPVSTQLRSPKFPPELATLDPKEVRSGNVIFDGKCAKCHGKYEAGQLNSRPRCMSVPDEPLLPQVSDTDPNWLGCGAPVAIGTDSCRARAVDPFFVKKLNALGEAGNVWPNTAFVSRGGYLCPPLDGIWARAPYLHNGSVPTLEDLLSPAKRPPEFERGNPAYDVQKGGFSTKPIAARTFTFNTTLTGNGATGHDAKDQIVEDDADRHALITYLLSL